MWPWPPYIGHTWPMWSTPLYMSATKVDAQELSESDSSLDSASEEFQDPHLDSPDLTQSISTSGTDSPISTSALIVSHTSVEVHSVAVPSADSDHTSLSSSSSSGVPSPTSSSNNISESDSPFAALSLRALV